MRPTSEKVDTRVLVLGAGGMLGRAIVAELEWRSILFTALTHAACDVADLADLSMAFATPVDVVINCAGTRPGARPVEMVLANTVGPHLIAEVAEAHKARHVVHISTDCVFDGSRPTWQNNGIDDAISARDLYGRSKAAGELDRPGATTIRTSFIGPDHGLVRFLFDAAQEGRRIEGWTNAWWSGSTVWIVARQVVNIAMGAPAGLVHLATARDQATNKYAVLQLLRAAFDLDVEIVPEDTPYINRVLEPTRLLAPVRYGLAELVKHCERPGADATGEHNEGDK
jgi:dTDP-4-dehydrorhamnose reductase